MTHNAVGLTEDVPPCPRHKTRLGCRYVDCECGVQTDHVLTVHEAWAAYHQHRRTHEGDQR